MQMLQVKIWFQNKRSKYKRSWSMAQVDQKENSFKQLLQYSVHQECHPCGMFPCQTKVSPSTLEDMWTLLGTGTLVIIKTQWPELRWCDGMFRTIYSGSANPLLIWSVHSVSDHTSPFYSQPNLLQVPPQYFLHEDLQCWHFCLQFVFCGGFFLKTEQAT